MEKEDKLNILLIEDDKLQVLFVTRLLQSRMTDNYQLFSAGTLAKGIECLSSNHIDIILLDLVLPDSEKLNTFDKIHEKRPNIPIIVMSGLVDQKFAIKTVQKGAQDYLVKGKVDGFTLVRAIKYAVERKQVEIALYESNEKYRKLFKKTKRTNKKLKDSNKKLKQTQVTLIQQEKLASIGQLAAGVAHELNNPLGFVTNNFNTLKNYIITVREYIAFFEEALSKCHNAGNKQISDDIEKIHQFRKQHKIDFIIDDIGDLISESTAGFERIMAIVTSLRNFSRVDLNGKTESYDLNKAIEDTLVVARGEIKYAADVEKDFSDVSPVPCNGGEINQVLLNIIVNAAQAIESQERSEKGKIAIRTFENSEHVCCEIFDDVPGIPEKYLNKIYDPFFTTKKVGKGTGLGLNISYDIIVNKHHGELAVSSKVGKGTKFTIKLPKQSPLSEEESDYAVF